MKYELPNIFLHFLNRDTQEIFGLIDDNKTAISNIQLSLNAAILLCKDYCIIPVGFYFESENAKKTVLNNIDYVREGLLVFAMREYEIQEYIEKKQGQLKAFMDDVNYYRFFSSDNNELTSITHATISRKTKIGEYCLLHWVNNIELLAEDMSGDIAEIYSVDTKTIGKDTVVIAKTILSTSNKIEEGGAFIWRLMENQLEKFPERDRNFDRILRQYFEKNYYKAYLEEYNASILYDIFPLENGKDFYLKKEFISASNYRWFYEYLKCLELDSVLGFNATQISAIKRWPEFERIINIYLEICNMDSFDNSIASIRRETSRLFLVSTSEMKELVAIIKNKILQIGGSAPLVSFLTQSTILEPQRDVDVKIGIVTALEEELAAMCVLLKNLKELPKLSSKHSAGNRYFIGEIESFHGGTHRVLLVLLPKMGNNLASAITEKMQVLFPSLESIIVCGIAGGIPSVVRRGDVVISTKGIIQYDFGQNTSRRFIPQNDGSACSSYLVESVRYFQANVLIGGNKWINYIQTINDSTEASFCRPNNYYETCEIKVDKKYIIKKRKATTLPVAYCEKVGSANAVQKDAKKRDQLHEEHKVYAVEMEGSGVSDATHIEGNGYLVVRGICDYCDKTKADDWHNYAAAAAAAYTRALIESMPVLFKKENQ